MPDQQQHAEILKSKRLKLENSVENKKCLFHYSKIISNFQIRETS